MNDEVKMNAIWAASVAAIVISLFVLIGYSMATSATASQAKFEQCVQNNGQWISESCVK